MSALVIAVFPTCGKSYAAKNCGEDKIIVDTDYRDFYWVYINDEPSMKSADFPQNCIEFVQSHLDTADIILVSSHLSVRQALTDAGIEFVTVYPEERAITDWIGRWYLKYEDMQEIENLRGIWDSAMASIENEFYGKKLYHLAPGQYLSDIISDIYDEIAVPNLRFLRYIRADIKNACADYRSRNTRDSVFFYIKNGKKGIGAIMMRKSKISVKINLGHSKNFYKKNGYGFIFKAAPFYYIHNNFGGYSESLNSISSALGLQGLPAKELFRVSDDFSSGLYYFCEIPVSAIN